MKTELLEVIREARGLLQIYRQSGVEGLPKEASLMSRSKKAAPVVHAAAPPSIEPETPRPARHFEPTVKAPAKAEAAKVSSSSEAFVPDDARLDVDAPSPEDRIVKLAQLAESIQSCQHCPLGATRIQTVFARGNPNCEVMFVGEGPGADEDEQGFPFVGKAGQLLDKMILAMGMKPEDAYIANIVKCRPPNNRKPEPAEMAACIGYLHRQIAWVRPKVIVALGATAVEGLLGLTGITKLRGQFRFYRGEIPTMPTYHPSYLLRVPTMKRDAWEDLKAVMARLGKKV
jgi:DNA polymerase